jgi:hypothetical protein
MQTNEDHWTSAAFRIISESLSVEEICAKINTQPTKYFRKGELSSKGNPKSRVREENLWLLKSQLSNRDTIEAHVEHFLSFLKENEDGIKYLQTECEFDIACAYSSGNGQGGFTLDHEALKELTAYPVDLSINLYPPASISGEEEL